MPHLSAVDLIIVFLYIAGTTGIGVWLSRGQKDVKSYFVGDRSVHWLLVLISIVATETSTVTFLSVPGMSYKPDGGNLMFLQLVLGFVVGRSIVAWFLLPQFFRGEMMSAYQLLRTKFDSTVQRFASGLFLITRTVADGLRLFLTALLLQQFTSWSLEFSIVAMGAVTLLYTYLGGMKAVIWTDFIQFVVYIAGALIAAGFILHQIPGGLNEYIRIGTEHHKFRVFDFMPSRTNPLTFWSGLIGGAVFSMASHGADQLMVQRYVSSNGVRSARLALLTSGGVVFAQFLLFLLIGVGLFALVQHGVLSVPADAPTDSIFGRFIVEKLPIGLVGLVVAAVLASAMSTLSSSLNSSANALVTDFYQPLRPGRTDAEYLRVSRIMTAVWAVLQVTVALISARLNSPQSIVSQVLTAAGLTTGLILGLFLIGSLPFRVSSTAALVGLIIGAVAAFGAWLPTNWGYTLIAWPWLAPIGAGATAATALLVHLLRPVHGTAADRRT